MSLEKIPEQARPETEGQTIRWASMYDAVVWLLSLGKGQRLRQVTAQLAQIKPGDRVLDVGCGTGDLTIAAKALAGPTGQVIGTDAAPEMIDRARQKAAQAGIEVAFQVEVVEALTFPENRFDIVLSSLMMHHLPDDLKRRGLAEIYRVLKPGGRVLIVDIESSPGGSIRQRLSEMMIHLHGGHSAMQNNVRNLMPLLATAGFTGLETDKINRQFSFITGKKPALS